MAGIILLALLGAPVFAQPDLEAEARGLVARLGDADWATRERAQRRMVAIGEPSRKVLRDALENKDPEIRLRASKALIALGETLTYAIETARSSQEGIRDHGLATLKHLLNLGDDATLRKLNPNEYSGYDRWGGSSQSLQIQQPPVIAIARLEALSGLPIYVSEQAREIWDRIMQTPTMTVYINGDSSRMAPVIQGLNNSLINQSNRDPKNALVLNAMRCGRKDFIYVTTRNGQFDAATRCADQLVAELLAGGVAGVRAASLLGNAVANNPASQKKLMDEFAISPALGPLYWLAHGLEGEDRLNMALASVKVDEVATLLASHDWVVMAAAARALECFDVAATGAVLSQRIENSTSSLELLAVVWCARGCKLSTEARQRVFKLLGTRQDVLTAAAVRWLGGASEVADAEVEAVWTAAQSLPPHGLFFAAATDLIGRPDVILRLEPRAREAIGKSGASPSQQALGAMLLKGRATPADLTGALRLVNGAQSHALATRLAGLFSDCAKLDEDGTALMVSGLTDGKADVRRRFMRVLRECSPVLRASVGDLALAKVAAPEKPGTKEPAHHPLIRLALDGVLAGVGRGASLDRILIHAEGDKQDMARAAGAALVDAFDLEALALALNNMRKKGSVKFAAVVAEYAYRELCLRAVETGDGEMFRVNQSKAMAAKRDYDWELQDWMNQRQNELRQSRADFKVDSSLPRDPALTELRIAR